MDAEELELFEKKLAEDDQLASKVNLYREAVQNISGKINSIKVPVGTSNSAMAFCRVSFFQGGTVAAAAPLTKLRVLCFNLPLDLCLLALSSAE